MTIRCLAIRQDSVRIRIVGTGEERELQLKDGSPLRTGIHRETAPVTELRNPRLAPAKRGPFRAAFNAQSFGTQPLPGM